MIYDFTAVTFFNEDMTWSAGTTTYNQVSSGDTPEEAIKSLIILLHADALISKELNEKPFAMDHKGKDPLPVFTLHGDERPLSEARYVLDDGGGYWDTEPGRGYRYKTEIKIDTDDPAYRFAKRFKKSFRKKVAKQIG